MNRMQHKMAQTAADAKRIKEIANELYRLTSIKNIENCNEKDILFDVTEIEKRLGTIQYYCNDFKKALKQKLEEGNV